VVLVPCVAVSKNCERLGHGKGYYDCFIERVTASRKAAGLPPPFCVALALGCQVVEAGEIPVEKSDQALDAVVGPSGAWYRRIKN
jgi:5-formyltetrahydrofolate cyclo-ligase